MSSKPQNINKNLLGPQRDKKCGHFKSFKNVFKNKIGQASVLEYTVFIVCLILALLAMQSYIKRGIQGKLRESADQIGAQYEPTKTSSDFNITSASNITTISTVEINEETDVINSTTVVTTNYDQTTRQGWETVGAF
jgi:hypothetical protein